MNNNANQLTNEQALQILTDLANLDTLKLNLKEHSAVQLALNVFKKLVEAPKVVELTPVPETPTV